MKKTGVIQIDEIFIRESQKGSRELVSYTKNENRTPRCGYNPSKYAIMVSGFATLLQLLITEVILYVLYLV